MRKSINKVLSSDEQKVERVRTGADESLDRTKDYLGMAKE